MTPQIPYSSLRLLYKGLLAAIILVPVAAKASIYNAQADFLADGSGPISPNPNGVWSYNYATNLNGSVMPLSDAFHDPNGASGYREESISIGDAPAFAKATTAAWPDVPQGQIALHSGLNGELAILRFTTPTAGTYSVDATWGAGAGGNVDVYLRHNADMLFSVLDTGNDHSFSIGILLLSAGDTIDLMVGAAGSSSFDSTPANLILVSEDNPGVVPEPLSMFTWCGLALTAYWGKTSHRRRGFVAGID